MHFELVQQTSMRQLWQESRCETIHQCWYHQVDYEKKLTQITRLDFPSVPERWPVHSVTQPIALPDRDIFTELPGEEVGQTTQLDGLHPDGFFLEDELD